MESTVTGNEHISVRSMVERAVGSPSHPDPLHCSWNCHLYKPEDDFIGETKTLSIDELFSLT